MPGQWADSSAFTDVQLDALMRYSRQIEFARGEVILHEGKTGNTFYQVLNGDVEVVKCVPDGSSKVTVVLSNGNLFGEAVLIETGEPRSATVRACTDVTVLEFDGPGVLEECNRDRDFAAKLYRMLCSVLRGYLGSTTVALAQAKLKLDDKESGVYDYLRDMSLELKRRIARDAAPLA